MMKLHSPSFETLDWEERVRGADGRLESAAGAAYYDAKDKPAEYASVIGMGYQIAALDDIDVSKETFSVNFELFFAYEIDDADVETYSKAKHDKHFSFQGMHSMGVKKKPPIFEIRNAIYKVDILDERITRVVPTGCDSLGEPIEQNEYEPIEQNEYGDVLGERPPMCFPRRAQKSSEHFRKTYVQLYGQYRATCKERMELNMFPFTRQCLQIRLYSKIEWGKQIAIPWNVYVRHLGEQQFAARANLYKADKTIQSWALEGHHIAFAPEALTPKGASNRKYQCVLICAQVKLIPTNALWNVCYIVCLLTSLSATVVVIKPIDPANRLHMLSALILAMMAYKVSLAEWLPRPTYLTFLDKYIVTAFSLIFFACVLVSISACNQNHDSDSISVPVQSEVGVAGAFLLFWFGAHLSLLWIYHFNTYFLYSSWSDVIKNEHEQLEEVHKRDEASHDDGWKESDGH